MASPHPQPTALKELRGNPGRRPLNKHEPKPSKEIPPCPEWLPVGAKAEWEILAKELCRLGILTKIDIPAFTRYCLNLSKWRECVDFLAANGPDLITHNETGQVSGVTPHPHTKRMREYETILIKYEDRFGLSPSARAKIVAGPPDDGDELDELLNAPSLRIAT